jgi:hypothetical protein
MWSSLQRYGQYPLKHWVLTLLLGPTILGFYSWIFAGEVGSNEFGQAFFMAILFVVFGTVLSIPAAFTYLLLFARMMASGRTNSEVIVAGNALVLVCMGITMWVIGGSAMPTFFLGYAVALLVGNVFLRSRLPARDPSSGHR